MAGKGSGRRKYTKESDQSYHDNNKLWDNLAKEKKKHVREKR